jgi:hypothetical protein
LDMQPVQALQANKLNLLHDVLSCIGEQGTEALVRYINENSVENHHHYNGRSLPYSKVFIAWKSAEFLNESWQAYWPISGYTWPTTDRHTFSNSCHSVLLSQVCSQTRKQRQTCTAEPKESTAWHL